MIIENENIKIVSIGSIGVGKTTYLTGMFAELSSGVYGWTIKTDKQNTDKFLKQAKMIELNNKKERFPLKTSVDVFEKYVFEVYHNNRKIVNLDYIDYSGEILDGNNKNSELSETLTGCIEGAVSFMIFIDDTYFENSKICSKFDSIKNKLIEIIRITDAKTPVLHLTFIITKYDLIRNKYSIIDIHTILMDYFGELFTSNKIIADIVPVSLGNTISNDDYSGEYQPEILSLPVMIELYRILNPQWLDKITLLQDENKTLSLAIADAKCIIEENKKSIIVSEELIRNNSADINRRESENSKLKSANKEYKSDIKDYKEDIDEYKRLISKYESVIHDKSTNILGIHSNMKSGFNSTEIQEAQSKIDNYRKLKKRAKKEKKELKEYKSENKSIIRTNQSEIESMRQEISNANLNINQKNTDINNQTILIEKNHMILKDNIEKISQYNEFISLLNNEIIKKKEEKKFISIEYIT